MCTDFTNLNKACPKDYYSLPCLGRKNMDIYVDDMLVKSKKLEDHLENLEESLGRLKECRLRINPEKCSFRVTSGKFLGFMISERGL
ncbi:hypothetical protein LIER_16338 [Lithospermum erythrorhizon]|uniref:Reverse transcriptase domain-containing protein n=1 Tax=Lithospermum erythrorhizon TaxID=34254 RepID=A0AAV3Q7U2_LITER